MSNKQNGRKSLTRAAFLEKAKARYKVVPVEGFGEVGLRSVGPVQASRRLFSYQRPDGQLIPGEEEKITVHRIIDQVMVDEMTPMFTDADFDLIAGLDSEKVAPLIEAIDNFNGPAAKN